MKAQIICVGTELLLGDVVNTNAADIAHLLAKHGIGMYKQTVVGDNPERLKRALGEAFEECDIVILTGGLGPTYDDLTKQTVADWFGKKLILDKAEEAKLRAFFDKTGHPMTENNLQQVMMPEGCIVLANPNGTAPGCIIEGNEKAAILMPGPPREMRPMLEGQVAAYLEKKTDRVLLSRTLNFFGIGESELESYIREEIEHMQNPTVAPYAKPGEVQLRITASGKTHDECAALIAPVEKMLRERFGRWIYGADYHVIQEAVVDVYKTKGLTLSAAESCTGGEVASRIIEIPGASAVFKCGVVAYQNEIKENVLGVEHEIIKEHTEVSAECALAMARGVIKMSGADCAVATTGYAGPGGENVGLVYIAAVRGEREIVRKFMLARGRQDDREQIRLKASSWALRLALKLTEAETDEMTDGGKLS